MCRTYYPKGLLRQHSVASVLLALMRHATNPLDGLGEVKAEVL